MNITETEFSTDLNPVRATVAVSLTVIEGKSLPYRLLEGDDRGDVRAQPRRHADLRRRGRAAVTAVFSKRSATAWCPT